MKSKRKPLSEELLDELKNELSEFHDKFFSEGTVRIIEPQDRHKTRDLEQLGWSRLLRVLCDAGRDERIRASATARSYLDLVTRLAFVAETKRLNKKIEFDEGFGSIAVFRPLVPALAGDKLRDSAGRIKGGDIMKQIKQTHIEHLTKPVIDLLQNPKTSDWNDPEIARWLMTPPNSFHVFMYRGERREVKEKTMTNHVKEIRAAYKASI